MVATYRTLATIGLAFCVIPGWASLAASSMFVLPVLLVAWAWACAWFGDDLAYVVQIDNDRVIRFFGVGALLIVGGLLAAANLGWIEL